MTGQPPSEPHQLRNAKSKRTEKKLRSQTVLDALAPSELDAFTPNVTALSTNPPFSIPDIVDAPISNLLLGSGVAKKCSTDRFSRPTPGRACGYADPAERTPVFEEPSVPAPTVAVVRSRPFHRSPDTTRGAPRRVRTLSQNSEETPVSVTDLSSLAADNGVGSDIEESPTPHDGVFL